MRLPGEQISQLLHEADDFHHRVFRIADGADDDLGELICVVAHQPVRAARPAPGHAGPQRADLPAGAPGQALRRRATRRTMEVLLR